VYPLSTVLVKSTSFIDKRMIRKGPQISRSELSEAIDITTDDEIQEEERKILQGIVRFGDIDVTEIMRSRTDVMAIDVEMHFDDLYKLILESGFSRIPVYQESIDKIDGMLYIKDLLPHLDEPDDFYWQVLIRPAFFVPENKKINDLLKEFQTKKIHFAIVVDEYGGTSGIVTLEDVLEEIVGEISDEFDSREDDIQFKKIEENKYLFEAKTMLNDFCKILDIDDNIFDDVKGDSDSLGGLILELLGEIPEKAEIISFNNFVFMIESVDNRRIKEVLVTINPPKE
jgi:gliding motility-associated protein GldE